MTADTPRLPKPPTAEAAAALEKLARAVLASEDAGRRVPCSGRREWISDDRDTLAACAAACQHCPVIERCREAARVLKPTAGCWAGHDYTRPSQQPRPERWLADYLQARGPSPSDDIRAAAATQIGARKHVLRTAAAALGIVFDRVATRTWWRLPHQPSSAPSSENWIANYLLEHGPTSSATVRAAARAALNLHKSSITAAAARAGVVVERNGPTTIWSLPAHRKDDEG